MQRSLLALALAGALAGSLAGAFAQDIPDVYRDWKELDAPPPPTQVRTQGLIPIEIDRTSASSLRFGVDPASITVGTDLVVRYVVVATSSSGAVNAMYEGIRCNTGEVKVYARHNPDSGWVPVQRSEWQDIYQVANSRHSLAIAKSGACQEHAPNGSPTQIARDLRAPIDRRYQRGGVNE